MTQNTNSRIRIKESIAIVKESDSVYNFIFTATRQVKRCKVDNLVKTIIERTLVEQEYQYLTDSLSNQYSSASVRLALDSLIKEGILRTRTKDFSLHNRKQGLFLEELCSSEEEVDSIQDKISNSVFTIFGTGGIGTWMVNGLYQIGVKKMRLVDPDVVDESNLNRQLFFTSRDIGKPKVLVLKEKLPDVEFLTYMNRVEENHSLTDVVSGSSFLVNCADKPSIAHTSAIIDTYATNEGIPYCVCGGYNLHLGLVGPIIVPGKTATFKDFLDYQIRNDPLAGLQKIKEVEESGNLGPIAGAVANLQLIEIFKYFTGKPNALTNRFREYDFLNGSFSEIEFGTK